MRPGGCSPSTHDLAAGTVLTDDDVRVVRVHLSGDVSEYLNGASTVSGRILLRDVGDGELLPAAALGSANPDETSLTVPVKPENAPDLERGQRVAIWVSTPYCRAVAVLADVTVQGVREAGTGALSAASEASLVIRVSRPLAQRVVTALGLDGATVRVGVVTGTDAAEANDVIAGPGHLRRPGALVRSLPILTALGGRPWEAELISVLEAMPSLSVVRRCVDVVDLLSLAASGQARAALVCVELRRLDVDAIDRLLAAEVVPVGVVARGDTDGEQRLLVLGVRHVVAADADAEVIAGVVQMAVDDGVGAVGISFANPVSATQSVVPPSGAAVPVPPTRSPGRGRRCLGADRRAGPHHGRGESGR